MTSVRIALGVALALAASLVAGPLPAQEDCKMLLCSPQLSFQPGLAITNLFDPATVRLLPDGTEKELERETHFAMIFHLAIPSSITSWSRISFFTDVIWFPFADARCNPLTGYCVDSPVLEEEEVNINLPTLEFGASFAVVRPSATDGWASLAFNVLDQFGPASEPEDARAYTHKLGLEVEASLGIFHWLDRGNWLRNIRAYAALDYLVTGLPDAGAEIPRGERVFLTDASPWSFWAGLVIPVAPIAPQP